MVVRRIGPRRRAKSERGLSRVVNFSYLRQSSANRHDLGGMGYSIAVRGWSDPVSCTPFGQDSISARSLLSRRTTSRIPSCPKGASTRLIGGGMLSLGSRLGAASFDHVCLTVTGLRLSCSRVGSGSYVCATSASRTKSDLWARRPDPNDPRKRDQNLILECGQ